MAPGSTSVGRAVTMHVPQAGDQELAGAVDDLRVLRDVGFLCWNNRNDAIPIDDHSPVGLSRAPSGVDYGDMFNRDRLGPGATAEKRGEDAHRQAEAQWMPVRRAQRFPGKLWNHASSHFNLILAGQYRHCPRLSAANRDWIMDEPERSLTGPRPVFLSLIPTHNALKFIPTRKMKPTFPSIDDYIDAQPLPAREPLHRVRAAIRKAVPAADESISYNMPTWKLNGERLLYCAAWKRHYSVYPATKRLLEAFRDDLAHYEINKSTIRFPLDQPVPTQLITRIAKFRAKELSERAP